MIMKHLFITIFSCCIALSALAQNADTNTAAVGKKLNFERPTILINNYFDGVKAHLSAEGRKEWKPEFSLRANAMLFDGSINLTGGIRTSQDKVFVLQRHHGRRDVCVQDERERRPHSISGPRGRFSLVVYLQARRLVLVLLLATRYRHQDVGEVKLLHRFKYRSFLRSPHGSCALAY